MERLEPRFDDHAPIEDEDRSPCSCGDPRCWIDGNDATNVQVNGRWFNADCAKEQEQVSAYLDADLRADDDAFNRTRR